MHEEKLKPQIYVTNIKKILLSYDETLKNWNIESDVLNNLEIEIIRQITSGLIQNYLYILKKIPTTF